MNLSGLSYSSSPYSTAITAQPTDAGRTGTRANTPDKSAQTGQLSEQEAAQLRQLKARDREVRQHEQAHLAAAGGLATSGTSFTYQKGPDGINYAVGGEVSISTSPGRTPEETLQRAQTIRAAALAPDDPSGADRAIAAQASQMEQKARMEIAQQGQEDTTTSGNNSPGESPQKVVSRYYAQAGTSGGGLVDAFA